MALTYNKHAPPVQVSTSLEGLEIGVPPPKPSPWLEKPLPKLPDRTSSILSSEESCEIRIVDHNSGHHPPARPRSKSDFPESPSGRFYQRRNIDHRNSVMRTNERGPLSLKTIFTDDQYTGVGSRSHLAKANHYFREKKWDFFPELAPHSPLSATSPKSSPTMSSGSRNIGRPRLPRAFSRQQFYQGSSEVFSSSLSNLKPVATQIQQTIAHKTSQVRLRKKPSQASMPSPAAAVAVAAAEAVVQSPPPRSRNNSASTSNESDTTTLVGVADGLDGKGNIATVRQRMRDMAPWMHSEGQAEGRKEGSISLWKSTSTSVLNVISQVEAKVPGSKQQPHHNQQQDMTTSPPESAMSAGSDTNSKSRGKLWKSTSTSVLNLVSQIENKVPEFAVPRFEGKMPQSKMPKSFTQPVDAVPVQCTDDTADTVPVSETKHPEEKVMAPKVMEKPILAIQTQFDADASVESPPPEDTKTARGKNRYVLIVYDGAKKKLAALQAARWRADLRRHIRVAGPVKKCRDGSGNQCVQV